MEGAPSQLDLFDYKPGLRHRFDQDLPDSVRQGQRITGMTSGQKSLPCAASAFKFARHGKAGTWLSELLPYTARLADDMAVTRRVIAAQDGPVILVGHSYGGIVITEAGTDPKVVGLVYVAAFAPDSGESVETLIKNPPPGAPAPPILPPQDGFFSLDRSKFAASFAADVNPGLAAFMADSQVPWGVQALSGMVSEPAWRSKPSWYLVSTEDKMIPPDAQRAMSKRAGSKVVEVKGSHAIYVSQPRAVASLIEQAANGSVSTEK